MIDDSCANGAKWLFKARQNSTTPKELLQHKGMISKRKKWHIDSSISTTYKAQMGIMLVIICILTSVCDVHTTALHCFFHPRCTELLSNNIVHCGACRGLEVKADSVEQGNVPLLPGPHTRPHQEKPHLPQSSLFVAGCPVPSQQHSPLLCEQ